jgi:hypothetical protein
MSTKAWKYAPPSLVALFAEALAGLKEFDQNKFAGWRLVVDTRTRGHRYGQCRYREKELAVSEWLIRLNGADHPQVKDTLLHEMAHVLAGPGHHHDLYWKGCAIKLGANPSTTVNERAAAQVATPPGYVSCCPKCNREGQKRPGKPRKPRMCGPCFNENRRNGVPAREAHRDCTLFYRRKA